MRSGILEKQERTGNGRYLFHMCHLSLKLGVFRAIFDLSGNTPSFRETLNMCLRGAMRLLKLFLAN